MGQIKAKRKQQESIQASLTAKLTKSLEATGDRLGNAFEQQLSTAIQDALTGGGVLGAIKQFAKAFGGSVLKELADGLAKNARIALEPFLQAIGQGINRLFGRQSKEDPNLIGPPAPGLNLTSKANLAKFGAGSALIYGGRQLSSRGGTGSKIGGALAGAAGGAMIGSTFGPIGTAVGAVAGAALSFFGGGSKKKEEKRQKQLQTAEQLVARALNGADQNNILDLQSRRSALLRNNKGLRGSAVKTVRAGVEQIDALIKAREKSIADALKEFEKQNKDLADQVALNDAKPFEQAAIERRIAIRQIEFDTAKLLEQFKDSEKAKTAILEQESLKRKLLQQEESDNAKELVLDYQDLLKKRDEISNANVFQRAKSAEQIKRDALGSVDKDIAEALLRLQGVLNAGITIPKVEGLNQVLDQLQRAKGSNATLNVYIDEANDPTMVNELINRAFNSFAQKVFGANTV